jgi:PAS domain S-box-containing protein
MIKNRDSRSLDHTTFAKMRRLYLIAFLLIALTIIIAQILIQRHLNSQVNDSRIVNIAGRQRMLSQKLVKELLLLQYEESVGHRKSRIEAAEQDLLAFRKTHHDLQQDLKGLGTLTRGNEEVLYQFQEIESDYNGLVLSVEGILDYFRGNDSGPQTSLKELFDLLITSEKDFLVKMDQIVYQYDSLSQEKVKNLKRMELFLLSISLGILVLEIVLLFRPISLYIKKVIQDLIQTQDTLKGEIAKVNDLYVAKENSLQELHGLNYAINNTALYANLKEDGSIIHLSKKFAKLLGVTDEVRGMSLDSLLIFKDHQPDTFKELIKQNQHAIWTGEVQVSAPNGHDLWLEMSVVPMNQVKKNKSVLLLCTDITRRIVSQEKLLQI